MVNRDLENLSSSKRRKLKSKVWDDFTKFEGEDGKQRARCNHCKKEFVGSSKSGTTHLKNHLERCPSKRNPSGGHDKTIARTDHLNKSVFTEEKSKVVQELNHWYETRTFIKCWRPLSSIMKNNITNVFKEEKEKLQRYVDELPCRFHVTIEAIDHLYFIIIPFIDDGWELKKRIIHLQYERYSWNLLSFLLQDWNMGAKICSLGDYEAVDFVVEEKLIEFVNDELGERGSLPLFENWSVLSGLFDNLERHWSSKGTLFKARKLVNYVTKTSYHEHNFQIAVDNAKSKGKKITLQGPPELHSSCYELLQWVMGFKEAFSELENIDHYFKLINFTEEDWDHTTQLYKCWKVLEDSTHIFCDGKYNIANKYFPVVCDIYLELRQWRKSENHNVRHLASFLRKDFEYPWVICSLGLVITVVLDPRFKMEIVERWYKAIYGNRADMFLEDIIDAVKDIYNEYAKATSNTKSLRRGHDDRNFSTPFKMVDAMGRPCTSSQPGNCDASPKSELDCYLEDPKFAMVEEFDILAWWRFNFANYPTLAKMARDFLAMPCSKADGLLDSSLTREIEEISDRHEVLGDDVREALVMTKVWLNCHK